MIKRRRFVMVTIILLLIVCLIWVLWGNTAIELNCYTIKSSNLPASFSGFRILHVSDLHNAEMGKENETLLHMIREANPDMIVLTGDIVDSRNTNIEIAIEFAKNAAKIAPIYFSTGNHESRIAEYEELKNGFEDAGVVVLEDAYVNVEKSGESITLIGLNDPTFFDDFFFDDASIIDMKLQELQRDTGKFTILLSHRPELFDVYVENGLDLVFSGHAHGGQVRLPFVGGLVAPHQGIFPKYDAGIFTENNTTMVVSRGVGNSLIPLRFNNRPEIILIDLETE